MKKKILVFMAAIMAFGFSAFSPQEITVENLWYKDAEGNPVLYQGATDCEPIITPVCMVEIGNQRYRLYYDPQFTVPVYGHD